MESTELSVEPQVSPELHLSPNPQLISENTSPEPQASLLDASEEVCQDPQNQQEAMTPTSPDFPDSQISSSEDPAVTEDEDLTPGNKYPSIFDPLMVEELSFGDELDLQQFYNGQTLGIVSELGGDEQGRKTRKYPCTICGKRFRFNSILSLHMRIHTGEKPFKCPYCGHRAAQKGNLKIHLRTHKLNSEGKGPGRLSDENRLLLELEERAIMRDRQMRRVDVPQLPSQKVEELIPEAPPEPSHVDLYSSMLPSEDPEIVTVIPTAPIESPVAQEELIPVTPVVVPTPVSSTVVTVPGFRCTFCKGKFKKREELERHIRILHKPYKCTLCDFAASLEEDLVEHVEKVHIATETPQGRAVGAEPAAPEFRCEVCGQAFTQSWFLKGHMRKHKDSFDHKCQICGRCFKEPWFLKNHMKVHLNKLGLKVMTQKETKALPAHKKMANEINILGYEALYSGFFLTSNKTHDESSTVQGKKNAVMKDKDRLEKLLSGRRDPEQGGVETENNSYLGYLNLVSPMDSTCVERLQAAARVAEINQASSTQVWQMVARGLTHQPTPDKHFTRPVIESDSGKSGLIMKTLEASQVVNTPYKMMVKNESETIQAYVSNLLKDNPQGTSSSSGLQNGTSSYKDKSSECTDCGRVFKTYHQMVVHSRVHKKPLQNGEWAKNLGLPSLPSLHSSVSGLGSSAQSSTGFQQVGARSDGSLSSPVQPFQGDSGEVRAMGSSQAALLREQVRGGAAAAAGKDCPYCGKTFRSSHHLKVHLRVHTGERPYKCPHCSYAGTQSGSLKYHLQRHHREQKTSSPSLSGLPQMPKDLTIKKGATLHRDLLVQSIRSQGVTFFTGANNQHWSGKLLVCKGASGKSDCLPDMGSRQAKDAFSSKSKTTASLPNFTNVFQRVSRSEVSFQHPLFSVAKSSTVSNAEKEESLDEPGVSRPQYSQRAEFWSPGDFEQNVKAEMKIRNEQNGTPCHRISRRKPVTTSKVLVNGKPDFEPLDLSYRPPAEDSVDDITLHRCVFCPFTTSSVELMAMHLQVNHTSKSRRKDRGADIFKLMSDSSGSTNSAARFGFPSSVLKSVPCPSPAASSFFLEKAKDKLCETPPLHSELIHGVAVRKCWSSPEDSGSSSPSGSSEAEEAALADQLALRSLCQGGEQLYGSEHIEDSPLATELSSPASVVEETDDTVTSTAVELLQTSNPSSHREGITDQPCFDGVRTSLEEDYMEVQAQSDSDIEDEDDDDLDEEDDDEDDDDGVMLTEEPGMPWNGLST